MTSLIEQVSEEYSTVAKDTNDNTSSHKCINVQRLKAKKIRPKCSKFLKRKLKKYKLRQDGQEDQDILDVSSILESSLTIKSAGEEKSCAELEIEQLQPTNYLFKMGRRKQIDNVTVKSVKTKPAVKMVNGVVQLSPTAEEKKQTNAFKLLMDSRNKSLGSNSPGKEKPIDETEMQELVDKKKIKVKRDLALQKMAESKGSLKMKEVEENQDKYINKKMEKRAERLKNMVSNMEPKAPKVADEKSVSKLLNGRKPLNSLKTEKNEKHSDNSVKTLQLVNIFCDVEHKISPIKKLVSKEDEDFLNKLSPSLKKKESMLSYFKKVEKEPDCESVTDTENNVIIKVQFGTKPNKKMRKKKLSLNKGNSNMGIPTSEVDTIHLDQETEAEEFYNPKTEEKEKTESEKINDKERRKRKRKIKVHCDDGAVSSSNILDSKDFARLRRSAKRPVKYNEDAGLSSSDDELVIFTPKKKKHSYGKNNLNDTITIDISSENEKKNYPPKKSAPDKKEKKSKEMKKPVKLAPIFSTKTQLDQAAIEAKQKFLQSGVPEKLKKIMSKQVDKTTVSNCFFKVVHIQQIDGADQSISVQLSLNDHNISIDNQNYTHSQDPIFKSLLNMTTSQGGFTLSSKHINAQIILQTLKEKYPRYPVNRTYRLLRGKKRGDYKVGTNNPDLDNSVEILNASIDNQNENPEQLSWSDKYKPLAASQIIGNFESVKELRKWLVSWTENDKATNGNGSDSSDYYQSDGDSKDSVKSSNNLLMLSGPVGSGKTSSVYAIAAELSIKVIEVNASSKRTGKIMLQDLQEATQSHKVNRQASSNENSQNSQKSELIETPIPVTTNLVKKRGRPKKIVETNTLKKTVVKKAISKVSTSSLSASQDITRTCMSLILIDDADIVFDQDDGFCSAIVQLVHCSKRPVILITSSLSCPHLQRFIQSSKILKMNPLLPNILGTWLDIMCLADSGMCWPGVGSKVLNLFNGDVRKTINCLQFYVCSQEQASQEECSQNTDCRANVEDENSNMSWAERFGEDWKLDPLEQNDPARSFMLKQIHSVLYKSPIDLFNIWWSVPKLLSTSEQSSSETIKNKLSKSLGLISQVLDCISLSDFFSHKSFKNMGYMASDPWFSQESHSVSELENFDCYDRHYGTREEIAHELAKSSISIVQAEFGCDGEIDFDVPGMRQQRQRERIISRHNNLTGYLNPQAVLDRKALALDYWSSCRTICRIEKSKTDTNSKRNNRFCHYLKSLSVLCKNDSFDKLANSLCPSEMDRSTKLS